MNRLCEMEVLACLDTGNCSCTDTHTLMPCSNHLLRDGWKQEALGRMHPTRKVEEEEDRGTGYRRGYPISTCLWLHRQVDRGQALFLVLGGMARDDIVSCRGHSCSPDILTHRRYDSQKHVATFGLIPRL
ncbi:unnamed protein product [Chondrus crispus]|uniref:Uncharacterized protein n=1 Tax=Chondrus crispus TaxID=2769 RepID=R7QM82_CHOCR|nr:unnamed protein product [Chondrus crispus]CDF38475.1 unnamed protein product [Chondrus crispus]|eukprot:XP_005718368.1 unnamed protein product [Chondrus crispus]